MSSPSERQLNDHLRRAVSAIPSNHAEEIWNMPVEKADSDAWFLEGTTTKRKRTHNYYRWASLAAACFAIIFIGWFQVYRVADATVYLDVNPSVTLDINRLGKVISADADNEDGRIILDNMDLKGIDADVAMNALLGSMVKHGYLSQAQNTLLISVGGKNEARTTALRQKLSVNAEQMLETLLGSGIVLGQTVDPDDAAEDVAEHYGITPGKAALIIRLLKDQPEWNVQKLAAMPMADLIRYCQAAGIEISQYLGEDGEVIGDLSSLLDDDDDHDGHDDDDHDDQDDSESGDDHDNHDDKDDFDDHDDKDDFDDHDDTDDYDEDDLTGTIPSHEESDDDDDRETGIIENHDDPDDIDNFDDIDDPDDENDSDGYDDDDEPDDDD